VVFTTTVNLEVDGSGEVNTSNEWYDAYCNNCETLEFGLEISRSVSFKEGNLLFKGIWYSVS
tara:strand:- start:692 stop:877 length:186 start_codon:yes stop_codon:yes gene_type:complete